MSTQTLEGLPCQQILMMWEPHELEAFYHQQQRALLRRLNRKTRIEKKWFHKATNLTRALADAADAALDAPFSQIEDPELKGLSDPFDFDVSDLPLFFEPIVEDDEEVEWSAANVTELHEGLLLYSLRLLNTRGNGKEKRSLLEWIFDPAGLAIAVPKSAAKNAPKVWRNVDPKNVPFSFECCCQMAGYSSQSLRDGLVPVLAKIGLNDVLKEIENERERKQSERSKAGLSASGSKN